MASGQLPGDESEQAQHIQQLTQQIETLTHQRTLLQRVNACLCQENQDLQHGRDSLMARLRLLEEVIQRDHLNFDAEGEPDDLLATSDAPRAVFDDRWLLKTVQIDYTSLKDLLAQQDWERADGETQRIMLCLAGAEAQELGFLTAEHISDFPCLDLKILNKLWTIYSNGKYGFMVQREIWSRTHSTRNLWHSPDMDGYYPRREGLGHSLAQRLLRCALDDF